MKRVALALAVLAVLGVAANRAYAQGIATQVTVGYAVQDGWAPAVVPVHRHYYCGPRVVYPPVWVHPRVVVPFRPPVLVPRYHHYGPFGGVYYSGPGVSIGVGF